MRCGPAIPQKCHPVPRRQIADATREAAEIVKYAGATGRCAGLPPWEPPVLVKIRPDSGGFQQSGPEYKLLAGGDIGSNSREEGAERPVTVANREINRCLQ